MEVGARVVLRALWDVVIPGLLAALVLRYLVPPIGTGIVGFVAKVGRQFSLLFGVALFLVFSWMVRHWRYWIPGGRYASSLPAYVAPSERDGARLAQWAALADAYGKLTSRRGRKRLTRALGEAKASETAAALADLGAAIASGDLSSGQASAERLERLAAPVLGAARTRQAWTALASVAAAAACAMAIRATLFQPYEVLSASMLPTLEPGDSIAGSKWAYRASWKRGQGTAPGATPHRGDVIVFSSAAVALGVRVGVPDVLVKRVIGLPGDRITMTRGVPVINGWALPTCDAGDYLYVQSKDGTMFRARLRVEFVEDSAYLTVQGGSVPFDDTYVVKPGEVFVLGDNRSSSLDSRVWNDGRGGGVPTSGIEARADRFLLGLHRSGDTDWGRFLRPIAAIQTHVRVEGVDERAIEAGIARCLKNRPKETTPPTADETRATGPSRTRGT